MSVMRWLILGGVGLSLSACRAERADTALEGDTSALPNATATAVLDAPPGDSGARKLLPVDEADTSFTEFRRQLLIALQQRDTGQLYAILAPEIKTSFGGADHIAGFKRIWKMENPDSSAVWTALTRALTLGGKKQGDYFVVPYVYAAWPDDVDAFQHVAVTSEKVPAYAQPDAASPVVALLSHSILPVEQWQGLDENGVALPGSFARVKLPDGRSLWVNGTQVYSPVGWRAFFEKRNGKWLMTTFVAGD